MMNLDPNLQKILDSHQKKIKRGQIGGAIVEGQDYLDYILGHDYISIKNEMDNFVAVLKQELNRNEVKHDRSPRKETMLRDPSNNSRRQKSSEHSRL